MGNSASSPVEWPVRGDRRAILVNGKGEIMPVETCYDCVYAYWDIRQAMWSRVCRFPIRPVCANHPDSLGRMKPTPFGSVCRNLRRRAATPEGDVKQIPVGNGFYAYVDAADYEWLSRWAWHLGSGYAIRHEGTRRIYMHRQIMEPPPGMMVDHINHNKLDNTRPNLRPCTLGENARNRTKNTGATSRFKGVHYCTSKDTWRVQLWFMGKGIWAGSFRDEVEAARAYDLVAVRHFGEFAHVNFPDEWPPERRAAVRAEYLRSKPAENPEGKRQTVKSKRKTRDAPHTTTRKVRPAKGRTRVPESTRPRTRPSRSKAKSPRATAPARKRKTQPTRRQER
jgi:hypothetical protein